MITQAFAHHVLHQTVHLGQRVGTADVVPTAEIRHIVAEVLRSDLVVDPDVAPLDMDQNDSMSFM